MNILVTGSNGQLGNEIKVISKEYKNHTYIFTDIEDLNLTEIDLVSSFIESNNIDLIINCAAYTSVDKAETETELAEKINVTALGNLAKICSSKKIKIIHISTDYVFDGTNYRPYKEAEITSPNSVYGKTKLAGEKILKDSDTESIILRTSWLYSSFGNNFVKTIIRLSKEREKLNVVNDQIGTPTYAYDLANSIFSIIQRFTKTGEFKKEIYHFSNEGVCSWYDFAAEIIELTNCKCKVKPIGTHKFPTPAKRPYYSVLNKDKIKKEFNIEIPYWKTSLKKCIHKLESQS